MLKSRDEIDNCCKLFNCLLFWKVNFFPDANIHMSMLCLTYDLGTPLQQTFRIITLHNLPM